MTFKSLLKLKNNKPQSTPQHIRKHHWLLGSSVILIGSWVTHTTTATVYDDYNSQQRNTAAVAASTPSSTEILQLFYNNADTTLESSPLKLASKNTQQDKILAASINPDTLFTDRLLANLSQPIDSLVELDETVYTISRGDTLGGIFKKLDFDLNLPHLISQHDDAKKLASLSIGKDLVFKTDKHDNLKQIDYPVSALKTLVVDLDDGAIVNAQIHDLPYQTHKETVSGEIKSSLYEAARKSGLSDNLVMELVRIFGWDIDFVLDIRKGDRFHVLFEEHSLNGKKLSDGNILAAEFTTQNNTYRAIRFEDEQGHVSYYTPNGDSMIGTFLRSPVKFSRISSGFGRRKHPILKKWRSHKGVDYAAARGTPIRATADGKVIHAGKKGGYGKTVVLRHGGKQTTLYAHMKNYAKGIRNGKRVRQGDIIGYIGSSGLATGPHLHYEFRINGVHRNPLKQKSQKSSSISAALKPEFTQITKQRLVLLDAVSSRFELASNQQK